MTSRNLLRVALASASLGCETTAFAGTPQNHHCKQSDGTMDMGKTKMECLAEIHGVEVPPGVRVPHEPVTSAAHVGRIGS